jgi:hypothetical protein
MVAILHHGAPPMPSEDRPISDAFSDSLGPAPVEPKATVMVVDDEAAVRRVLGGLAPGDPVAVTVIRGDAAVPCDLGPLPRVEGR